MPVLNKAQRVSLRNRFPLASDVARLRHVRTPALPSELVAELGQLFKDRRLLREARNGRAVCWLESASDAEPLVTVRIATRDRPEKLLSRSVDSALRQTYERIEVLVVGDGCDSRTADALRSVRDDRVRYVNLPRSGNYPSEPARRWRVAGVKPMNAGVQLAAGDWIAPCDDDDELTDDHVEKLITHAKNNELEFVWSKSVEYGTDAKVSRAIGDGVLRRGALTHGSILYSLGLSFFEYSLTADRLDEPSDWNLVKRMERAGVKMGFLDAVTYLYYPAGMAQYEPAAISALSPSPLEGVLDGSR
jgi:hypothetical protein